MFLCFCDRDALMGALQGLNLSAALELGVHRGDNAQTILDKVAPKSLHLVDAWSSSVSLGGYTPFAALPPGVTDPREHSDYFGGPLESQDTFEKNYRHTASRFENDRRVTILLEETDKAFEILKSQGMVFDFIYIDANHQYEYVLRDLKFYSELLSDTGVFMLNDATSSAKGRAQNLGVLEAISAFTKASEFRPVAMTAMDFADVILCRSPITIAKLSAFLTLSRYKVVHLPDALFHTFKVTSFYGREILDFGDARRDHHLDLVHLT